MTDVSRDPIDVHLGQNPEVHRKALHDPMVAAGVHQLRTVLDQLDRLLVAEGLDEDARQRVKSGLAAGSLGTDADLARQREQETLAAGFAQPVTWEGLDPRP
ncbi:hypothetical protein [Streptomyces cinereoruber]|uniref:hypothetical protein n=1 Tax=Streptomyces cinereoruber TaxID=67260 RepID=UPI00363AE01E